MLKHLIELRRRLLFILASFGLLFVFCFYYANTLLLVILDPLLNAIPKQQTFIATQITTPVTTSIRLATTSAFLPTLPIALFHLWHFASPGLYTNEKRQLRQFIAFSLLLFAAGVLFGYYLALPLTFQVLIKYLPNEVRLMPEISVTVGFIIKTLAIFGLFFQIPLVCLALVRTHFITVNTLKQIRPYVIVSAFIIGMLLTPPDVLSQILLALPLCALYEMGILLALFWS